MCNFYHEVLIATSGHRKFSSEFFTQISEQFCAYFMLHLADHYDLGIIGKIFSSCKSSVLVMPILMKGDDAHHPTGRIPSYD